MGLDDREWMRRESEERWREGITRKAPRRFRLNALHLLVGGVFAIGLILVGPPIGKFVTKLLPPSPLKEPRPVVQSVEESASSFPSQVAAPRETAPIQTSRHSLQECLQGNTVLNEDVIRCQHGGELPRKQPAQAEAQGMVSSEYLATYQAERDRRISQRATTRNSTQERNSQWIKSWDSSSSYLAEWIVVNNTIDGTSVCGNHRRGSIEYRECRKGAKVYFREQCRAWGERANYDRKDLSYSLKDRYCTAERSFSPMG
jgi:hypothetical protein